jgi:hypothetical protein
MSQHDMDLANASGAAFRADANLALTALASNSSGASAPSTTYAYQTWYDTTTGTKKRRNAANSGWIVDGTIDETRFVSRSSNTMLDLSDMGKVFLLTSSFTQTLDAAATLGDGWRCDFVVQAGVVAVIDPNSTEQIDGATTLSITGPACFTVHCTGTAFYSTVQSTSDPAYTISTTRSSNAETITITPSTGASLRFRNATAGTGDYTDVQFSSALTLVLSSGSTLGASSGVPFCLWLVAFNDAGTLRLGAVNTLSGTNILALNTSLLLSSTAEGGAGAADSGHTVYTGTAVTSKAFVVLGYLEYTLATAGTWVTAPSKIQIYDKSVPLPGTVINYYRTDYTAVATGTTALPLDNTVPQNTEGDQYMTVTVPRNRPCNLMRVSGFGHFANSANAVAAMALFQDSTAGALKTGANGAAAAGSVFEVGLKYVAQALAAGATTFNIRAGSASGTTTFNGSAGAGLFNATYNSYIEYEEVQV